ncbi:hypothetical protein BDN71DRAFT_1440990 [Pleurotus eryngii]|uniref:Uncharacterized protein n=1 Tax=Pleurotus eryngii TaxID=5323 RepID=A0A9P6A849_PLEER|nr:hypothetical protein BDN71DRAFT_1440990 [Pleurotus eryngii]
MKRVMKSNFARRHRSRSGTYTPACSVLETPTSYLRCFTLGRLSVKTYCSNLSKGNFLNSSYILKKTARASLSGSQSSVSSTVSEVLRPDGVIHLALCVGDNRIGILRPQPGAIEEIAERFFNDEPPQWHLDPWYWQWKQKLPRVLSPSEAREWAIKMNAREAALEKLKGIHISE